MLIIALAGCVSQPAFQSPVVSPLQPPSSLATPTMMPTETPLPTPTSTVTPVPSLTPTPSPSPTPTATYPPYADTPFTLLFIRDGNLWLSEIGGSGKRQLTHEPADWPVTEYAISPSCDRIAYIPYKGPPEANALIKQVALSSGVVSVLTGEEDAYIEYGVGWIDDQHLTFVLSEFLVAGRPPTGNVSEPFHHLIMDLNSGQRTLIPESLNFSPSPDGRYWLTCSMYYVYEGDCKYQLEDRETSERWPVAQSKGWGSLIGWSPDSRQMLFSAYHDPGDYTVQLMLVDTATRRERLVTPTNKTAMSAAWSPDGRIIAYTECGLGEDGFSRKDCSLQLLDLINDQTRTIPIEFPFDSAHDLISLAWTTDGSRLILSSNDEASGIWSIQLDGTDLRPVVSQGSAPKALCKSKE
jgi:WD40-like Beta Propeller Repeat